jgi:hypothetical protein
LMHLCSGRCCADNIHQVCDWDADACQHDTSILVCKDHTWSGSSPGHHETGVICKV